MSEEKKIHVKPVGGQDTREHEDEYCWCEPTMIYKDPDNGNEVWEHRRVQ